MKTSTWPDVTFNNWKDTLATIHLWTQIIGKIRLRAMPWLNHSWHVTLYVTPKGLSTGSMPYANGVFEIEFNFIQHVLTITTSDGAGEEIKLSAQSVADFYTAVFEKLKVAGVDISIYPKPSEIENAIPFYKDDVHKTYKAEQMQNFWQALILVHNIFTKFRAGYTGKCSPVHFFWGAFDLAFTRFSGRPAPLHKGTIPNMPPRVMQEAYSHEVSSCGFWPGSEAFPHAAFYAYCYPEPSSFKQQPVEPAEAFYSNEMGEYLLLYDVVRMAEDAEATLMQFLTSTYKAAAVTGNWNRNELECDLTSFEK